MSRSMMGSFTHNIVESSVMAEYLQCIADDLDDTLTPKYPFEETFSLENGESVNLED